MIQTQNLTFSYDGKTTFAYPDLSCGIGEKLLIKGQSGCGKTTLLHLLSGVVRANSGQIFVNEKNILQLSAAEMDQFRGQNIGIVSQRFHFIESLTVEDNIRAAAFFAKKEVKANHLLQIADLLGIRKLLARTPALLSLGEQQRVCIARAIINAPSVLLADEPTSSLDDNNCTEVLKMLVSACDIKGTSLLVVTHDHRLQPYFERQIQLT